MTGTGASEPPRDERSVAAAATAEHATQPAVEPTAWQAIGRGWRRRCPRCGQSPIFERFIDVRPRCTNCDFVFEERSGDTWGFWVVLDRVFVAIPLIILMLGFATSSLRMRLVLIGLLLIPLLGTMPNRQGVAIALDYLFRRRQRDA